MKAIETTATIKENGVITLDRTLDITKATFNEKLLPNSSIVKHPPPRPTSLGKIKTAIAPF